MDERYENEGIKKIWANENKLSLWQKTELAAIEALVILGEVKKSVYEKIKSTWESIPIDIQWWKKRDTEIHHDLNAFLDERLRHLAVEFHKIVHPKLTSFDTQEAAFARMVLYSLAIVDEFYDKVEKALIALAVKYRFTIMFEKTHGQGAEIQTFGARCLSWLSELRVAYSVLTDARKRLKFSKMSGAIGKYGSIDPQFEKEALKILGFEPFYGATQIMPRIIYAPVADALNGAVQVLSKIALDIRLGARSGRPIMREPFGKKQKGSSAMPHKRNPILTEQVEGMSRMAKGYTYMIQDNIRTWEARAIEQSCVERVAWPDLFHVTIRVLSVMGKVLSGLKVYPDNMLLEIYESQGAHGSVDAKEFLKERLPDLGLGNEDAYRIIQLAAFNVSEPDPELLAICERVPNSLAEGLSLYQEMVGKMDTGSSTLISIEDFIPGADLYVSGELEISQEKVNTYNSVLKQIFDKPNAIDEWRRCFNPSYLLRNESVLYSKILGI